MYGAEVWGIYPCLSVLKGLNNNDKVSPIYHKWKCHIVQMKFYRRILGLSRKSPVLLMLGDLGEFPLFIDVLTSVFKYWSNTMNLTNNALIHQSFLDSFTEMNQLNNYQMGVKNLLHFLNFPHTWENFYGNAKQIKTALQNNFITFWTSEINDKEHSRYQFYASVKKSFHIENYLVYIRDFTLRAALSRLRMSSHNLMIEKGRHLGLRKEDRVCDFCQVLEDENHFIFHCKKFTKQRDCIHNFQKLSKLDDIFNDEMNNKCLVDLAKYTKSCLFPPKN